VVFNRVCPCVCASVRPRLVAGWLAWIRFRRTLAAIFLLAHDSLNSHAVDLDSIRLAISGNCGPGFGLFRSQVLRLMRFRLGRLRYPMVFIESLVRFALVSPGRFRSTCFAFSADLHSLCNMILQFRSFAFPFGTFVFCLKPAFLFETSTFLCFFLKSALLFEKFAPFVEIGLTVPSVLRLESSPGRQQ